MLATRALLWLTSLTPLLVTASEPEWTKIHEPGRCALRGQCGHNGLFGRDLPCADNGVAEEPSKDVREQLVSICGEEWADTKVCCRSDQLDVLQSNLKTANNLLSACGACKKNFYDLFCTFTCSPDQSLFVNVTETEAKGDKFLVKEIDQLISDDFGGGFYDSCKDVSFGSAGAKVMDFFGNSKNYTQLLKFLGDKSFLGSPFQINFPRPTESFPEMETVLEDPIPCNTTDEIYHCACVDCAGSCPVLSAVKENGYCYVGLLPCLSFAVVIVYSVFIALLVLAVTGHVAAAKRRKSKNERLQLLQDIAPSEDEDEGHIVHSVGMFDRPTKQYVVNTFLDRVFSKLGRTCSNFPAITISSSVIVVGLLSLGWIRFAVETDPVKLWVAPDSDAAREKEFFDTNFGPFFRTEQAFLVNDTDSALGHSPVLNYNTLAWWFDVERRISVQKSMGSGYTLKDVCYNPTGEACVIQSLSGYFTSKDLTPKNWEEHILECSEQTAKEECRPEFKLPIPIERVLGGYNRTDNNQTALQASALVTTWVVTNYNPGNSNLEKAEEWEESLERLFHDVQQEAKERGLRMSFSTEMSLEQELNKNTNTDAKIVVISYIVMFIYASLALGSTTVTVGTILRNPIGALVQSKFMLGIVGILIVLMSVAASVGLFAAAGVKATLIIAEVIPFLVLAVGVDNIFLIVHEFERVNISHADEDVSERVARTLGRMGPSILLSALTETVAFALGAAVGMPAVRNFAAYAAGAVFINAVLQVTMFVSILALNQRRVEDGRLDCIPCLKVQSGHGHHMPNGYGGSPFSGVEEEGFLSKFIRKHYAPAILGKKAKVAIMTVFVGFFAAGIALLPHVELGLDQRIAIPLDSYLIKYFDDLDAYFGSGAPVYFVVKDANVTARPHQQDLCARYTTCHQFSLASILEQERKRPDVSYIAEGTASWIDDFFQWLNPEFECCFDGSKKCFEDRKPAWNNTLYGMPEGQDFIDYATRWLDSQPSDDCPMAGKAAYGDAVVINNKTTTVKASHFRTAHSQLSKQEDFIKAYASARRIAKEISDANDVEVFPYSKFYIFFDQYATIARLATGLVGAALAFILVISSLLLGSIATGMVVTMTVLMIVVDIVGTMSLVGVSLNAVSLVNIIICVGIGVEFCAHIARAYTIPSPSILERAQSKFRGKDARAWAALVNVGGSVFSGITVTKLLGVFVLAFTRSKIFEIYYFRVWLALVLWAALHALVFLPVALSIFGGRGYIETPETDGGLEQDLASRRYRALLPDDEYSDDGY